MKCTTVYCVLLVPFVICEALSFELRITFLPITVKPIQIRMWHLCDVLTVNYGFIEVSLEKIVFFSVQNLDHETISTRCSAVPQRVEDLCDVLTVFIFLLLS